MRVTVRRATPQDTDWLLGQLKAFAQFMGTKRTLFGPEDHVRTSLLQMIENHVVLVAEREDGELMGMIGGLFVPHVFNPEISLLAETFWWVAEAHRGSRAGLLLLNEFVKVGHEYADWITMALEQKSPVDVRCLTKRGFRHLESNFLLEVS